MLDGASMDFENEATYLRAAKEGKVEEFQRSFDKALEVVVEEFGQIHPIYIAGDEGNSIATLYQRGLQA